MLGKAGSAGYFRRAGKFQRGEELCCKGAIGRREGLVQVSLLLSCPCLRVCTEQFQLDCACPGQLAARIQEENPLPATQRFVA